MALSRLPAEVWLAVCAELDPLALDNFGLSCRSARSLLLDEHAWRDAFRTQLGAPDTFTSVNGGGGGVGGGGGSWRSEYITRTRVLKKYRRYRGRSVLFDPRTRGVTELYVSPGSGAATAFIGNAHNGLVAVADTYSGKVAKHHLYPSSLRQGSGDVSAMHIFRHGVLYGYANGTVAFNNVVREASRSFDSFAGAGWHGAPVTALAANAESAVADDRPNFASGARDGSVRFWNWRDRRRCLGCVAVASSGIVQLAWQRKGGRLYCLCADGSVRLCSPDEPEAELLLPPLSVAPQRHLNMAVDGAAEHVVVFSDSQIRSTRGTSLDVDMLTHAAACDPAATAISARADANGSTSTAPGGGGAVAAYATADGSVHIFDTRSTDFATQARFQADGTVTAIAISPVVCCVGMADGRFVILDALTGVELRTVAVMSTRHRAALATNIAAAAAAAAAEAGDAQDAVQLEMERFQVDRIALGPTLSSGVYAVGGQVRAFDVDPFAERANGKRRGLHRKRHATNGSAAAGSSGTAAAGAGERRTSLKHEIQADLDDMHAKSAAANRERKRLEHLAGGQLARDLTTEELVAYASFLSAEASQEEGSFREEPYLAESSWRSQSASEHRLHNGTNGHSAGEGRGDEDLDEAIRRSLADATLDESRLEDDGDDESTSGSGYENRDVLSPTLSASERPSTAAAAATAADRTQEDDDFDLALAISLQDQR